MIVALVKPENTIPNLLDNWIHPFLWKESLRVGINLNKNMEHYGTLFVAPVEVSPDKNAH